MPLKLFSIQSGRILCWALVGVDLYLGGLAAFFPAIYASIFHPNLLTPAVDFIVRTGILWLMFLVFQLCGAVSKDPRKWFFAIGIIRLMEVPADLVYSQIAIGASDFSRLLIIGAPVLNCIIGVLMLLIYHRTNP